MTEFLLFTLYAPLASWGDIAVGEMRGTWDRPSRSAVLGLVAASLGLLRDDQAAHDALDAGYGFAVRVDAAGSPLGDYHTTQTVAASIVKRDSPATRAAMLQWPDRETIVSRRGYREDALATVALWERPQRRWPLGDIADALRRPVFVLYAGRKANALGMPLAPQMVSAATLADAFVQRAAAPPALDADRLQPVGGWGTEVAHDPCEGFVSGLDRTRRYIRRDAGAHRMRWQFRDRAMDIGQLPAAGAGRREA